VAAAARASDELADALAAARRVSETAERRAAKSGRRCSAGLADVARVRNTSDGEASNVCHALPV